MAIEWNAGETWGRSAPNAAAATQCTAGMYEELDSAPCGATTTVLFAIASQCSKNKLRIILKLHNLKITY